ncbi:hypothetical protein [Demequina rhizosphaerae]|uniref:hypothetical protein n=1 Tax=Demequina rhizosphaerae TaxID=1638985 RepID=UPI000781BA3E|nr:hypothetical protein [Demequina rhizosphaerae]
MIRRGPGSGHGPSAAPTRLLLVVGALAVLIVVNVVQFVRIDATTPYSFAVFKERPHPGMVELSMEDGSNASSRYAMTLALGHLAPGSTVILTADGDGLVDRIDERLYGYGRATDVVEVADDVTADLADLGAHAYVAASGPAGNRGPAWRIVLDDRNPPVLAEEEAGAVIDAIRAGDADAVPAGAARELALVAVQAGDPTYVDEPENLLVETSLLDGWDEGGGA